MKKSYFHSYCKINLSLRVIKKTKSGLHKIQTLVTFGVISDQIYVKKINSKRDFIVFYGPFNKSIDKKNNTIIKTLEVLRKNNFFKNHSFEIKIKKSIPIQSGLGGGSMNAASLLNFFNLKYKLKINQNIMYKMAKSIGSDVELGLKNYNTFFSNDHRILKRFKNKLNLFTLLVKPDVNCSTKNIYSKNRKFSKEYKIKKSLKFGFLFNIKKLTLDVNDLEEVVFRLYPKIEYLIKYLKTQEKCLFSRMSGSGSVCVGYFKDLKSAKKANVKIKKKFPSYWCKLSKTL